MKTLFIYNQYNAKEVEILNRIKNEFGNHVDELKIVNVEDIKNIIPIRETPAMIVIRDDYQGINLTDEQVDGELLVTALMNKEMQDEDLVITQTETNRLDILINEEIKKAEDDLVLDIINREVI